MAAQGTATCPTQVEIKINACLQVKVGGVYADLACTEGTNTSAQFQLADNLTVCGTDKTKPFRARVEFTIGNQTVEMSSNESTCL